MCACLQILRILGIAVAKRPLPVSTLRLGLIAALVVQIGHAELAISSPITLQIDASRSHISLSNEAEEWTPLVDGGLTTSVSGTIGAWLDDNTHALSLPDLVPDDPFGNRIDLAKREVPGYPGPATYYVSNANGLWDAVDIGVYLFGYESSFGGFLDVIPNSSRSFPLYVDYILYSLRNGVAIANPGGLNGAADVTYSRLGSQVEVLFSFDTMPQPGEVFRLNGDIVATATVPEPSSLTLAAIAAAVFAGSVAWAAAQRPSAVLVPK